MNGKGAMSLNMYFIVMGVVGFVILLLVILGTGGRFGTFYDFFRNLPSGNLTQPPLDGPAILGYNLEDGELYFFDGSSWNLLQGGSVRLNNEDFERVETKNEFRDFVEGKRNYKLLRADTIKSVSLVGKEDSDGGEELFQNDDMVAIGGYIQSTFFSQSVKRYVVEGTILHKIAIDLGEEEIQKRIRSKEGVVSLFQVTLDGDLYLWEFDEEGKLKGNNYEKFSPVSEGKASSKLVELSLNYFKSIFDGSKLIKLNGKFYPVERNDPYIIARLNDKIA